MADYSGLFERPAQGPSQTEVFNAELERFLTSFVESQPAGRVKLESPNRESPSYRTSFFNDKGHELSRIQFYYDADDSNTRPYLNIQGWNDDSLREVAVDTFESNKILTKAILDSTQGYNILHPYLREPQSHGYNIYRKNPGELSEVVFAVVPGKKFADIEPQMLASALMQYTDDILKAPNRIGYRPPVSYDAAAPLVLPEPVSP